MATTPRSEAQDACPYCRGKLSIIVSRDPDEEVDCVCTERTPAPVVVETITFPRCLACGQPVWLCPTGGRLLQ